MIQFSNIVRKWRENNSFENEQKNEEEKLKFNVGAQKILKKVSESCSSEREISQKKYSDVLEKLDDKVKPEGSIAVKKDVPTTSGKHTPKPTETIETVVAKDSSLEIFEQIEEDLTIVIQEQVTKVSKNVDWEEDDFTEGLFEQSSYRRSEEKVLPPEYQTTDFDDEDDADEDPVIEDHLIEEVDKSKHTYQKEYRSGNRDRSKYKGNSNRSTNNRNRPKEYNRNYEKKDKRPYKKEEQVSTNFASNTNGGEHLNIENVLKSMKSSSNSNSSSNGNNERNDRNTNNRRNFSPRKNDKDKKNRHKWV